MRECVIGHRRLGSLALLATVLGAAAGCQAVIDFNEDRICQNSSNRPLDCRAAENVPDEVFDEAGANLECVAQACNRQTGRCEFPADPDMNGNPCQPTNPCIIDATCKDGVCTGSPAEEGSICDDSPCAPGTCQGGECVIDELDEGESCDDMTGCSINQTCEQSPMVGGGLICQGEQNPDIPQNGREPCDDGNLCTTNTFCFRGRCQGNEVECDDGEECNPGTGTCQPVEEAADGGMPM